MEGVSNIREVVFTHFSDHFKELPAVQPRAIDLNFQNLSNRQGADLIKSFTLEEVKVAV